MNFFYIFFCIFFISFFLSVIGITFNKFISNSDENNQNFYENILFGTVIISFIALIQNFFISLDPTNNTITISLFLVLFYKFYSKKINYNLLKSLLIISTIVFIIIIFDNTNRPDAGLYHLPFTKLLNDSKILIGSTNINFRFGHTSILQYTSAFFNNHLTGENGILIPPALILASSICYFYKEAIKIENNNFIKYLSSLIFLSILLLMNRYSKLGNDFPAHIFFIITFFIFIKDPLIKNNFFKIFLLAVFVFGSKTFLILVFLFPLYHLFFKPFFLFNKITFLITCLLFCILIKNLLISSCFLYPIKITCIDKLPWTVNLSNETSAEITAIEGEAWAKGYPDRLNKNLDEKEYSSRLNWLSTWTTKYPKQLFSDLNFFLFACAILVFVRHKNFSNYIFQQYNKKITFSFYLSCVGIILWFFKFPLYRYGASYIIIFLILITIFNIRKKFKFLKFLKYKQLLNIIIFFSITIILLKNVSRITKNYQYQYLDYPWPKKNSYTINNNKIKYIAIYDNKGKILYFRPDSDSNLCMYGASPCTTQENVKVIRYKFLNYEIIKSEYKK